MQDRFRFRVWKANEKRMVEGVTYLNPLMLDEDIAPEEAKNNILMQCTGLKDKNGKLIYESDIVKQNKTMYCVTWEEGSYGFCDIRTKITYTVEYVMSKKQEVIGNIYENPELLED